MTTTCPGRTTGLPSIPPNQHRHTSCLACGGIGYVRPDGGHYPNRSAAASARRRTVSSAKAARRCECCTGLGGHRIA